MRITTQTWNKGYLEIPSVLPQPEGFTYPDAPRQGEKVAFEKNGQCTQTMCYKEGLEI